MRTARVALLGALAAVTAAGLGTLVACGAQGFDPQSKVDSLRVFAVRADKPYAKPGETVTMEALLADRRKDKTRAPKLFWIPVGCLNPRDDLYYLCFIPSSPEAGAAADGGTRLFPAGPSTVDADGGAAGGGGGAGASAGFFGSLPPGVDLSPFLPQGSTFTFRMPDDAIQPRRGSSPYGLVVVFNIACAGSVHFAPRDPNGGPQQVPFSCTDEDGQVLPPSDYVIGISRVYSYADRTNTNPVIEKVTLDGQDVDLKQGITVDRCRADKRADCKEIKLDVRVSDASWELNPSDNGEVLHEQIWVDYYADVGDLDSDARLLFDTRQGRISDSEVKFRAPADPTEGLVWAVVHDNRGGAAWITVPVHVR